MNIIDLRKEDDIEMSRMFKEFYNTSIFTWAGMNDSEENLNDIVEGLKLENPTFYIFSGEQMNFEFCLTGKNSYQNDLTFVAIKDYYNPIVKIQVGARWFDDIVDNNARRQGYYPDYVERDYEEED